MTTILIVEDEEVLSTLMRQQLEVAGFQVDVAGDGDAALALLTDVNRPLPDIIFSDLLMPGMNGYELLEKLHADPRLAVIPCLVLSNSGQVDDLSRAFDLGAKDVLIKTNFNPDQLVDKVKMILE